MNKIFGKLYILRQYDNLFKQEFPFSPYKEE